MATEYLAKVLLHQRYKKKLDDAALERGVHPQPGREFAFVATIPAADGIDIVGAGQYVRASEGDDRTCEFAITVDESWQFGLALRAGNTNPLALAIGAGTLLTILLLRRHPRLPGVLVAVVGATLVGTLQDLASTTSARAGVPVLGALPQGLPGFSLPSMGANDIAPVLLGGLAVALISFADTSVLSRTYAGRTASFVDPNQEMVGLRAANLAAGLFQGFPISASASSAASARPRPSAAARLFYLARWARGSGRTVAGRSTSCRGLRRRRSTRRSSAAARASC